MKLSQLLFFGFTILLVGVLLGWIIKPSTTVEHMHGEVNSQAGTSNSDETWTCSMHPQVRQNEFGICPICEMDLITVESNTGNNDPTVLQMSSEAVKLAQIQTTAVGAPTNNGTSRGITVEADGTIELDEQTIHVQSSHLEGRVESINVSFEGEYVKEGQKIATIYSTELLAASQELLAAQKLEGSLSGLREATIQKLKNWKISDQQIQAILDSQKPLSTIDIYADHGGFIMSKKVSLGDYVKQGEPLYTIGSTDKLWLVLDVYESELENIKIGQQVRFKTPSTGEREFSTRVSYIEPLLDNANRTAKIRADINSRSGALKPGMLVNASIQSRSNSKNQKEGLMIPNSAILWTGDRSVVYVKVPDAEVPTYQFREVEIEHRTGAFAYIKNGIVSGEEVVTNGAFAIDAAAQLNNNMSMMNRDVTVKSDASFDVIPDYKEETPDDFKIQLDKVADTYINIKDALVNTDVEVAASQAKTLLGDLQDVDMTLVLGEAHEYWMEQMSGIKSHTSSIVNTENVDDQRQQFEYLTEALLNAIEAFGTIGSTYYVQYCPMAFNNKGADWISAEEKVQNPYFGDKMLRCGSVKRVLE